MLTLNRSCCALLALCTFSLFAAPAAADTSKGACCVAGGTCVYTEAWTCVELGGEFQEGTTCSEVDCAGACCFTGTGDCSYLTQNRCRAAGGVYQGDGIPCAGIECELVGACCLDAKQCVSASSLDCEFTHFGDYQGDDTSCKGANCEDAELPEKVACCLAGGVCLDASEENCAAQGGQANDGDCVSVACVGACCFIGTNTCAIRTQSRCRTAGGVYQGDGTTCTEGCATVGACCDALDLCEERTQADCAAAGLIFQGFGTECIIFLAGASCPSGACCVATPGVGPGGCFADHTPAECAESGGVYQGDATDCTDNPCDGPGACCNIDGSLGENCSILTPAECAAWGGVFQGEGAECDGPFCPRGACCFDPVGAGPVNCEERYLSECLADGGSYQGHGTICSPGTCGPELGSCCLSGGGCEILTEGACQADRCGDTWTPGGDCAFDCPQPALCQCDLDGNGTVDFTDLLQLISAWGPCTEACPADADGDLVVGFSDLLALLTEWGSECDAPPALGCN